MVDLDMPKPGDVRPDTWNAEDVNDGTDVLCLLADRAGATVEWDTYTARTGRGGTHLYYRHPDQGPQLRNTSGDKGNGLGWLADTRAHGGYVVAAGSVASGRRYTVERDTGPVPLPGWLATALVPKPLPAQAPVVVPLPMKGASGYVRTAVERECATVTGAPDHHNDALYHASIALGQLVAGGSLDRAEAERALEHAGIP